MNNRKTMTKNNKDNSAPTTSSPGRWKPTRAIGVARALMKAGYGTRKQTSTMVTEGRITVDEKVVLDPNRMLEPGAQIYLDGEPLAQLKHSYYALNKPVRVVCSPSDGPD